MNGWRTAQLRDVFTIKPPKTEAKQRLTGTDLVSFVPMRDLGELRKDLVLDNERPLQEVSGSYTYFSDNDVLLAKITPCFEKGKLGIAQNLKNGIGFGSSEFIVFRPNGEIHPEYLFYFLSRDEFRNTGARSMTGAVGHKRVPKDFIEQYLIPYPALPEQKRIITILDEAFAAIATATANAEKNLANARELFESFLTIRLNRVASNNPTQTLADITQLIVDCEHKTAPTQATGYPSIRTPNIGQGQLILENVNRVSEETYQSWTRRAIPQPNDLILAREAPAGNVAIIPDGEMVCLGQRTVLIRPNSSKVDPQYLTFLLLHPVLQKRLLSHSTGATVQHVNLRDIRALALGELPPLTEQRDVVSKLNQMREMTERLVRLKKNRVPLANELKQSILQKAFTGELTAADADIPTKVGT